MTTVSCPLRPLLVCWGVAAAGLSLAAVAQPTAPPAGAVEVEAATQQVVVTASRWALAAEQAPAVMSVVTRRDIQDKGANNLLEALRAETGITLQGRAIGGRKVMGMRGLDAKHTLFLIDGRRVGASDGVIGASDFSYDWISADDIERIEVVRGPLSVLYGSEALGGVVNVITREPGDRWAVGSLIETSHAAGGRGGDGERAALRFDGPLGAGFSLRAGAAASRLQPVSSAADPRISELEGRRKEDAWMALLWRGPDGTRVDLEHREGREQRSADARERTGRRRYHLTENDVDRQLSSLGWETVWKTAWLTQPVATQLRAYQSSIDIVNRRTEGVAVNVPQRIKDQVLEGQARLDLEGPMTGHALTTGFEVRNETLEDPGLPGGQSVAEHRALYIQDEAKLTSTLAFTGGLRLDRHQMYGSELSPRLYWVWRAAPEVVIKGGYSRGFKAPNLKQIVPGGRVEGPNLFLGNPDLQPEHSDSLELAVARQQDGSEVKAALFHQRVADLIDVQLVQAGSVAGTGTYTYVNLSRARLRGVELSGRHRLGAGFTAGLSYAYLDARNGDGQRLERRPRHSASLSLDWQQGAWRAGLQVEHQGDQRLPSAVATQPAQPVPDITLVGAHAAWSLPAGLELSLGVRNLNNVSLVDKSPLFTQAEAPRTWRLGLRGRW